MKGLKAEENVQWEFACYRAKENLEKSVIKDLHKSYSANHWKAIKELFQILGFTSIDNKCIFPGNIVSEAFVQFCEKFIEICNQSLLLFSFKSHAKTTPDLNSAIKAINAIAGNWCDYTIKSDKKRIGSKGQQVWQYSYRINHQPYNGIGFEDKGVPELPPRTPIGFGNYRTVPISFGIGTVSVYWFTEPKLSVNLPISFSNCSFSFGFCIYRTDLLIKK
jgi:hypothetical protein